MPPERASSPSTSERIRLGIRGDRDCLDWVVTRFTPLLRAQAAWRLGSRVRGQVDPDDVVAEAWLVALRRRADLLLDDDRTTARLLSFLGTTILHIVNRRITEIARRGQREAPPRAAGDDARDPLDELEATVTGAVTKASRDEVGAALDECLASLPEKDRVVVLLRAVEGLSNQEAAEEIGEPATTVSHRYRRALEKLRRIVPNSFLEELPSE